MTRWYQHRYHTMLSHQLVFTIIPHVPKFVQPPIAMVTALIFFFLLRRERRALVANLSRISPEGTSWSAVESLLGLLFLLRFYGFILLCPSGQSCGVACHVGCAGPRRGVH